MYVFLLLPGIRESGSGQPPGCGLLFEELITVSWVGLLTSGSSLSLEPSLALIFFFFFFF
jgi:hypothetical protein